RGQPQEEVERDAASPVGAADGQGVRQGEDGRGEHGPEPHAGHRGTEVVDGGRLVARGPEEGPLPEDEDTRGRPSDERPDPELRVPEGAEGTLGRGSWARVGHDPAEESTRGGRRGGGCSMAARGCGDRHAQRWTSVESPVRWSAIWKRMK